PEALCVKVGETHIGEVAELSVKRAGEWFGELPKRLTPKQNEIAVRVLKEIRERLKFLVDVGLDYLTLARASGTLSGGESQRIRLASQIGSGLTGVLYVLDEPSIGLHQRDNARLLETLRRLRDLGNTVIVVEHDEDAILTADYVVDVGPGAGVHGGRIVAQGPPHDIMRNRNSITGAHLTGEQLIALPPRSNPATYTGAFTPIREWFAGLPEAKARGYEPGRFSFNVKGGRCEACQGDGVIKIEMHFLPDVYVTCDTCKGKRYNRETLEVLFKSKSIADVLDMTVEEAAEFFKAVPRVRETFNTLRRVGLDYIHVGQQATTLSGGEAQRVKLAKE